MVQREIPPEQWPESLDRFGRGHEGQAARVTLIDAAAGARSLCVDRPLLGLIDERHGRDDESVDESVTVMWSATAGGASSHTIRRPHRVSIAEWNDGYSARLEIETAEGQRLVIAAGPEEETLAPGMVTDGVLLEKPS